MIHDYWKVLGGIFYNNFIHQGYIKFIKKYIDKNQESINQSINQPIKVSTTSKLIISNIMNNLANQIKSNQIKSLLLSHRHSTGALVSVILESVL